MPTYFYTIEPSHCASALHFVMHSANEPRLESVDVWFMQNSMTVCKLAIFLKSVKLYDEWEKSLSSDHLLRRWSLFRHHASSSAISGISWRRIWRTESSVGQSPLGDVKSPFPSARHSDDALCLAVQDQRLVLQSSGMVTAANFRQVRVHFSTVTKSVISADTVILQDKITLKWQCQVKWPSFWQ